MRAVIATVLLAVLLYILFDELSSIIERLFANFDFVAALRTKKLSARKLVYKMKQTSRRRVRREDNWTSNETGVFS